MSTWRHAVDAKMAAGRARRTSPTISRAAHGFSRRLRAGTARGNRPALLAVAAAPPLRTAAGGAGRTGILRRCHRDCPRSASPRTGHARAKRTTVVVDRKRALFGSWYEFFPRSTGGWDEDGMPRARHVRDRRRRSAAHRRDGVRRRLPATDPPDRRGQPQGPQQHPHRRARRRRLTVGDRLGRRRPRRDPPGARNARGLPGISSRAPRNSASRSRSISHCSARPTIPGPPNIRSGSPCCPTGPSRTPRTRRRSTRTSIRSTSTTTATGSAPEVLRVVRHWISLGVKIFRVDNPHTKPPDFWEWLIRRSRKPTRTCCSWPRRSPGPPGCTAWHERGFTQSYTYFTWRVAKWELTEFGNEIAAKADEAPAQPVRQHARTSCTRRCSTAGRECSRCERRSPRPCPPPGASTPGTNSTNTWPSAPAARSTSTRRSTSCVRAVRRGSGAAANRSSRGSPRSTASAARTPGPAAAAQPALPPHRQRRADRLLEIRSDDRRRRARRHQSQPVRAPRKAPSGWTCRRSATSGTTSFTVLRRGDRRAVPLGPGQLCAARTVAIASRTSWRSRPIAEPGPSALAYQELTAWPPTRSEDTALRRRARRPRTRLAAGEHHDPHSVLGAHPHPDGTVAAQRLRPDAESVALSIGGTTTRSNQVSGRRLRALVPYPDLIDYRPRVDVPGCDHTVVVADGTGSCRRSANSTSTCSARDGTNGCGTSSARTRGTYETPDGAVERTSFAVWAPDAPAA